MIIGRKREQELLERAWRSKEAEFITVYGRRRVGKTFLIREFFHKKNCIFLHVTGLQHGSLKWQLKNFIDAVSRTFFDNAPLQVPADWSEALHVLTAQMASVTNKKVVIFFDELPWMATKKSRLIPSIDFYWNNQWSGMEHVIFIACGSSASWLLKNIIYHRGGLHNRTTIEMKLIPFKLCDVRDYLEYKGVRLNEDHILSLYMAIGGIPYYLNYIQTGRSAQQNIQALFFDDNAPLAQEYTKLFESLFDGAEHYRELIEMIAQKKEGISRKELVASSQRSSSGGFLTEMLSKLRDAGFIEENAPWGKKLGSYYKVVDEFCLFYIRWVLHNPGNTFDKDYWVVQSQRPAYYGWAGYAFEAVCSKHMHEIIRGLDIRGAGAIGSWRFDSKSGGGAQIDLVIDRLDNAITLCEMKYTNKPFVIDKKYAAIIGQKVTTFKKQTKTDKQIFFAMISAHGLQETMYSQELISAAVTYEDLFREI